MTDREVLDLIRASVDDSIVDLRKSEDREWAKVRQAELEEALDMVVKALDVDAGSYKIVGRNPKEFDNMNPWRKLGKCGTVAKKRMYPSRESYEKHGPELVERWRKFQGLDIECYKMVNGEWVLLGAGLIPAMVSKEA